MNFSQALFSVFQFTPFFFSSNTKLALLWTSLPGISHVSHLFLFFLTYFTFLCIMNLHSTVFFKCYSSQTWQGKSLCFTINFSQKFYIEIHHTCHNLNFLSTAKLGKEVIRDTNASHAWRPTEATQNLGLKASGLEIKTGGQPTKASSHSQSNDFPSLPLHFLHVSLSSGSCQRGAWCCPVRSRPFSNKLLKFLIWLFISSQF